MGTAAWKAYERAHARRGLSPTTLETRRAVYQRFLRHVRRPVKRITRKDVLAYLAARQELGVAATSQRGELSVLRSVFSALVEEDFLRADPTAELVVAAPAFSKPPVVLSTGAVCRLLRATGPEHYRRQGRALSFRDRAAIELLYALGLRASEVCAIQVLDLSLKDGSLFVRRAKGGKDVTLPLPPACLPHLAAYLREGRPALAKDAGGGGHLFLTRTGRPLPPTGLGVIVRRIAKRVGVRVHPHAFRRTLATHLAEAGVSLEVIRLLLGHVQLENTARYVVVSREALRKAVAHVDRERPRSE